LHQTSETKKKLGTLTFFYPKHNQSSSKQVPNQTLTFHIMQTHHTNQYSSKEALQFLSSKNCPSVHWKSGRTTTRIFQVLLF